MFFSRLGSRPGNPLLIHIDVACVRTFSLFLLLFLPRVQGQSHKPTHTPPDTLQQHFDKARTFSIGGDQEHAVIEYKAFLVEALRRTGNALAHENKIPEAIQRFQEGVAIDPQNADVRLDYAVTLLESGDLPEAKLQAETATKAAPGLAHGHYVLGRILFQTEDFAGAKAQFEALTGDKTTFDIGYNLGRTYLALKDIDHAKVLFQEILAGIGDSAQLHIYFGHAYLRSNYPEQAIAELQTALKKDPKVAQAHYFLGLAYLERDPGRFDEASTEYRAEVINSPNDFRAYYELGNIELKDHKVEEAERDLKKASVLDPGNPDPLIYLGELYASENRPSDAEPTMRRAIALTKDVSRGGYQINRAHYVLGRILIQSNRREEGLSELKISSSLRNQTTPDAQRGEPVASSAEHSEVRILPAESASPEQKQLDAYIDTLKPEIADAYNNLGAAAAGQKDYAAALEDFNNAAKWYPHLETLQRNQGMALFHANRYQDAIPPLYRHLEAHSDDSRARGALGLSYFMVENYSATAETLSVDLKYLDSDPGLATVYAVSLVKTGRYDDGMGRLKAIEQANPNSAEIHISIGESYADQGVYAPAIEEYRKALALDGDVARAHFLLGLALLEQGNSAASVSEFRTALKANSEDPVTKYHLAVALINEQQKDEAFVLLHQVIQQDKNYSNAYYQLGKLELEGDKTGEAIGDLQTAIQLNPSSEFAHYQLSLAYRRGERSEDAEREMKVYQDLKARRRGPHEKSEQN
jgi:tetratricopeptide (TPR) repeat protein